MKAELIAIVDQLKDEIIRLKNEIASLKSQKEMATKEWELVEQTVSSARKEIKEYESLEVEFVESTKEYIEKKNEVLKEGTEVIRGLKEVIDLYLKFTYDLRAMIAEMKDELNELGQKKEEFHKEMTIENEELSKNKADLDIYKARLEKRYEEIMPGHKIIL